MVKRRNGFSLMEVIVTVAILAVLVIVLVVSQREAISWHRTNTIDYISHPDQSAVIARVRRDVIDSSDYGASIHGYTQSKKTLLLVETDSNNVTRTIVYDFNEPSKARRLEFSSTGEQTSEWIANGVPAFTIGSYDSIGKSRSGVRLKAYSPDGVLVLDQVMVPRA